MICGTRHMYIMILVSAAVLGSIIVMHIFQPESELTYKQTDVNINCLESKLPNFPRLG